MTIEITCPCCGAELEMSGARELFARRRVCEPGEPIGEFLCPVCARFFEVVHGDEPGTYATIGSRA